MSYGTESINELYTVLYPTPVYLLVGIMVLVVSFVTYVGGCYLVRLFSSRISIEESDQDPNLGRLEYDDPITVSQLTQQFEKCEQELETPVIMVTHKFWKNSPKTIHLNRYIVDIDDDSRFIHILSGKSSNLTMVIDSHGGDIFANDPMVRGMLHYQDNFGDITCMVPYQAYSAATMLALAGRRLLLGPCGMVGPFDPQMSFDSPHTDEVVYSSKVIMEAVDGIEKKDLHPIINMVATETRIYHSDNLRQAEKISEFHNYEKEVHDRMIDHMCSGRFPHSTSFAYSDLQSIGVDVEQRVPSCIMRLMDMIYMYKQQNPLKKPKNDDEDNEEDDIDAET